MTMEITPRALSPAEVLTVWETARRASPSVRALVLMRSALPASDGNSIATWCIGEGDALLFRLQRLMFGNRLECAAVCPACATALELTLEVENLLASPGSGAATYQVTCGEPAQVIFFRLPNRSDLQALPLETDEVALRKFLVERCVLYAERNGEKISPAPIAEEIIAAVSAAMADADPQAEILLHLVCPNCAHVWQTNFDIVDFLWRKIHAAARQLLYEIHCLAQAYGWTEAEILALSPARRQIYLELALS